MIAALVLAAGAARRFGSPKLVQPVRGEPLVRASVERVLAAGPERTIVVVGHGATAVRRALAGLDVQIVTNPRPDDGLSSSLRAGLAAVPSNAVAVLIALGDQPITHDEVIPALIARFGGTDVAIVAPKYSGDQGLPVVFSRAVFPELEALTGDRGARSVVEADPARVAYVEFDFPMPPDVDTPGDLEFLMNS
ncbi:MAG TPA: nucleotidyltransferase family protein [Gemmatimonadaceae bacterium]|nr:nucleotidyltransferase family protein [Gemmatimonadaceae bacterium]